MLTARFDDQVFTLQSRGGISRYFVELLKAFDDPGYGVKATTDAHWTINRHLLDSGRGRQLPAFTGERKKITQLANRMHNPWPRVTDVVHHTFYDRRYLKRATFRVVTIYDMIPELFPELFPSINPHADKLEFVRAADLILCISEATRRDLVGVYGNVDAPIVVTPLGVNSGFGPRAEAALELPEPYVLYVGDRSSYKDFWVLAEAFAAADLPTEVTLLTVGGGPLRSDESERLQRLGLLGRTVHIQLDDRGLATAFARALVFVFPSRYEGFGLPTLEAMAAGCPTILSSESSHPEVGGDAARYFQAGDVVGLTQSLEEVSASKVLQAELGRLGVARAATFQWGETARRTAEAYRDHIPSSQ